MHQTHPFLTRKGDSGFNPRLIQASKGDRGFRQPDHLTDRGLAGLRADAPATHQHNGSLVWRAPEGPEGTGGLRGAAPNEVRPPSLAGGRALRRPEHQRGHKQRKRAAAREGRRAFTQLVHTLDTVES